jgi:hypothetical protein
MNPILAKLASVFLNKKKVIGWIASAAMVALAAAAGMQTQEFKDAVCSAPVVEQASEVKQ